MWAEDKPAPTTPTPAVPAPAIPPAPVNAGAESEPISDPSIAGHVTAPALSDAPVTPSKLTTETQPQGASVTTISKQDVETAQDTTTSEALRFVPGVTIGQTGRTGSITNLFIRGGNNNQTDVLFDGWRVNRQGQGYDFDGDDPTGLQRIEVSRGMGSVLYGSEALTGAVNILTQKGYGDPTLTTSAAGGTYGTDRETVSIVGTCDKISYNVSASHYLREGASEPNSRLQVENYSLRFDYDIDCDNTVKLIVRGKDLNRGFYESASLATQLGPTATPIDYNDKLQSRDTLVGFEYTGRVNPIWETDVRLGFYQSAHDYEFPLPTPPQNFLLSNPARSAYTNANETRPTLEWRNTVTTFESDCIKNIVTAGAYLEFETFDQADTVLFADANKHERNASVYVQDRVELFDRLALEAGIRHEDNGTFGGLDTGRGNATFDIHETHTRVFGSVGNGFRPPSFFELYAPQIGNPHLRPEANFAYDAGVEQRFWCDKIVTRGTYFDNHFSNFISLSSVAPFTSTQQPFANTRGYELEALFKPVKQVTFSATGSIMHTADSLGLPLIRRPDRTFTGRIVLEPLLDFVPKCWSGLQLYCDILHTGNRIDLTPGASFATNPFDVVRGVNPSYTRVDVAASYSFCEHWRVFGKVNNATDIKYQDVKTFPADRSNVLAGFEFNWKF